MGVTVFYSALLVLMNLVVDLLYGIIDPRIKYELGGGNMSEEKKVNLPPKMPIDPFPDQAYAGNDAAGGQGGARAADSDAANSTTYWKDAMRRLRANKAASRSASR